MPGRREFFVSYEGELSDQDRQALIRPGWTLYENGIGATAAFRGDELPLVKWRQVIRMRAVNGDEAARMIADALGREPENLRVDSD